MEVCFRFVLKIALITQRCFVTAEHCLHSVKVFSAPHTILPASGMGVHKKFRGDTAGAADPN